MRYHDLVPARFLSRPNRFLAHVMLDGHMVSAHVANPGRCAELLLPGRTVWLEPAIHARRKTAYTLSLVEHEGVLVSMRSHLANDLLAEALAEGWVDLDGREARREVRRGHSRFDFVLGQSPCATWVEVKSATLVVDRAALFPDAPTARGRRHIEELEEIVSAGERAMAVFVVQREDADLVAPHAENDPLFALALSQALEAGVEARAYRCSVSLDEIRITQRIPVHSELPERDG
jgi:sugar fermentation stimulation protein A